MFHSPLALTPLTMLLGIGVIGFLTSIPVPKWGSRWVLTVSAVLFEMYVIHTYLFSHGWAGNWLLDLLLSLGLIMVVSISLHPAGKWLGTRLSSAYKHSETSKS